jgi:AcrR family transcriptional regulator
MREGSREKRERILCVAAEVIRERGMSETRIADVGERMGMSPGNIMYYFRSRDELLMEAVRREEDNFYTSNERALAEAPDATSRLVRFIDLWCPGNAAEAPAAWVLWPEMWARSLHHPGLSDLREELDARWVDLVSGVVREGQSSGEFDADVDARRFAYTLGALVDGLALRVMIGDREITREVMRDTCVGFAAERLRFTLEG